jgi:streptomycin 6-kinase
LRPAATGAGTIPPDLIGRAISCFQDLASSQGPRRLLHGDLHHHNILFDDRRGWVAIDPKGVIGESAYEIGAALRNPTSDPAVFAVPSIIKRRISIVSERLALDPDRILRWAFAQGVLSAVWRVADGRDPRRGLATASAILPML